ncbi:caspase family protein [Larkinella rosea]|uniref:Tetratricopeptide repeat protein n=1 Tax=Larkinella rosea TaxID=2025312 RepID=A0A3P1BGJ7_9BACT|nr:caspase family protein [Larkinella rosea]RRB00102.1 tetratricopeptide repeat protein [Larkinella rosea]
MKSLRNTILLAALVSLSLSFLQAQSTRTAQQWMDLADQETDPQKALAYYKEVLKIQPDGPTAAEAYNGCAVMRSGPTVKAYREALEDIEQAIRRNEGPAKYYAQRAYIYVQLSEYDRAARDYEQAIRRAPAKADYYSGLSYCQTKHGRFDEAETTAQKGIDLDAKSPYAYRNRGRARLRKGQIDVAIADFQTSLQLKHGQLFRVYCDLGEAYEQKGDSQQALKYYQQALDRDPDFADALVGKRQLEQKLKTGGGASILPASNFTGRRVALVLGNSGYQYINSLDGQPANDARSMEKRLTELGFETVLAVDLARDATEKMLREFYAKASKADVVLVFYAGHGVQHHGENYLLPIDIQLKKAEDIELQAFSVTNLIDALQKQEPRYCIFIIDACRDDPFSKPAGTVAPVGANNPDKEKHRSVALPKGIEQPKPGQGMARGFRPIHVESRIRNCYVALATAPGATARNGPNQNGYYTSALLTHLKKGRRIDDVFRDVRSEVVKQTQKSGFSQQPEYIDRTVEYLIL